MTAEERHVLGFRPVPRQRAFDAVILQIEEAILQGRLRVGDRLPPERELAEIFQVSRPSVREALRALDAFGILRARRGTGADSGSIVAAAEDRVAELVGLHASLLEIPLTDLMSAREALETWAARLAARFATTDDAENLSAIVERMEVAIEPEAFLEHDTKFHMTITRLSRNTTVTLLMGALREAISHHMLRGVEALKDWPGERDSLIRDHRTIAQLIAEGREDEAANKASSHIRGFYGRVLKAQDSHGSNRKRSRLKATAKQRG